MNIILKDGRKELYQWDTGRQIQFDDPAVGQAHFANKLFGRSMDVDIVDGVCTIPDELLQTGRPLHVYAWVVGFDSVPGGFRALFENNGYLF